ncbi:phosphotransferase family protein [Bradyrhizobium sp. PMVTL-01]|uniref:phosphotransferase family protein n=1 Tax=Bradyrhizobium sp. PMVTL-01 TaxID=3434999 RepID=UPI003F6EE61A
MTTTIDFDPIVLHDFLDAKFGRSDSFALQRISGGQSNPSYFVEHGVQRMVLRKQPNGPILPGAHAVDREFRVLEALYPTGVPVARPVLFHSDPGLLGTPFYLMERVDGRVFTDCSLPTSSCTERRELWMALAEALAAMHTVRPDEIGLADYGRPGNYFERQIGRWTKQWLSSSSDPIPEVDRLSEWLPSNMPLNDGTVSLAHGDYRMGNVIFHPTEPRVVGILDWELSTLGHPLADLGFCAIPWHTSPNEYGGILGLDRAALGLPSEQEFVARYMKINTACAPLQPFHKAFALFRFAVIFVGIADRARQGNAASTNAAELAPLARRFAIRGLEVIEGKHEL